MENRAHALAAGFFVLLLGLAALGSIWWFGGKDESTRDIVVVTRGNVTGLNPHAQVRYRGIRVGKVLDLRLDPADKRDILIRIRLADDIPLTQGTTAKLAFQGVTGLAHVLLEDSGKNPAPLGAPADGGEPRIAMQPSLIEELGDAGQNVLKQAQEFLTRANAVLDQDNRRRLGDTLTNVETTTRQLAAATAGLPETMGRLRKLLSDDNLHRVDGALASTAKAAATTELAVGEWRQLARDLQDVARQVETAVGSPGGQGIAGVAPRINELAGDLSATSRQLNRVLTGLEAAPQSVLFGAPAGLPGPGEAGFVAPQLAPQIAPQRKAP